MKLVGPKDTVLDAFKTASKVLAPGTGKAVPQEIKMECLEDGSLRLFATDLERSLRCERRSDDLKVREPGETAVPGPKTLSILNALDEGKVEMETSPEGNFLEIRSKGSLFKVNASPVEEFPPMPEPSWEDTITLEGGAFRRLVERTAFATAQEKIHFSLHGVFVRIEKKNIRMVGTDGRRLAVADGKVERAGDDVLEMIVPTKGVRIFEELAQEGEPVTLSLERNQLFLRTEDVEAGTLLIDGKYPDYDKAMPKGNDRRLEVNREEFFSALRKASVFADAESKGVWFRLEPGRLVLFSNTAGTGEAEVEVKAAFEGEPLQIQFNPDFLRGARKLMEEERLSILLKDHKTAALFHHSDDFTYVVMPIVKK